MALKAVVTGAIADPVLRWTPQQKAVLDVRMNATASNRDKNSGEWSDIGSPLWVSATFWDDEAKHLSQVLHKGERVTVEGTLVIETYHRRDGGDGVRYVLRFPRFLGVIPSRRSEAVGNQAHQDSAAPYGQPAATTGSIPAAYDDAFHGASDNDSSPF